MATRIHRFDLPDPVPQAVMRIAVKDAIDVAGSGELGRAVVADLLQHGYDVVNVDLAPPPVLWSSCRSRR
jgi:hypothetical protein